jgi:hypothetical protein
MEQKSQKIKMCDICNRQFIGCAYYRHIKTNKHLKNVNKKQNANQMLKDFGKPSEKSFNVFLEKLKSDITYFLEHNI